MFQQFVELVMNLPLVFVLFVFFFDFALEHLEEFGFEQHFLYGDENFQDHLKDLTLCEFEANAVGNDHLVVDQLVSVQIDEVVQLVVDYLELLPDELFEQEDISVLVHVVKSVDVCSQCSPDLPSVCAFEAVKAVRVRMDIFQLADVDEVFALHYY